ncbi:YkvA family protein, partial [Saccharopolyspora kobensis]
SPVRRARAVPGMLAATARGRNPVLPRYQLLLWLIAVVYMISPIDFIPDFLPLLGIGDDIGVGAWLLTSLYAESGNYLAAKQQREEE